jgi:hypothetical protein
MTVATAAGMARAAHVGLLLGLVALAGANEQYPINYCKSYENICSAAVSLNGSRRSV